MKKVHGCRFSHLYAQVGGVWVGIVLGLWMSIPARAELSLSEIAQYHPVRVAMERTLSIVRETILNPSQESAPFTLDDQVRSLNCVSSYSYGQNGVFVMDDPRQAFSTGFNERRGLKLCSDVSNRLNSTYERTHERWIKESVSALRDPEAFALEIEYLLNWLVSDTIEALQKQGVVIRSGEEYLAIAQGIAGGLSQTTLDILRKVRKAHSQ